MASTEQKTKKQLPMYSWFLKRQIAIEYLQGGKTLEELSKVYSIPHQSISRWSSNYSKDLDKRKDRILGDMTPEEQKHYEVLRQQNELLKKELASMQLDQDLKKENEALKKELGFAQMKAKAMEVIIDLAKEEYGIDLTKNSGAKQPVKLKKTTRRQQ
jgi:cell shape-determining protein MreC